MGCKSFNFNTGLNKLKESLTIVKFWFLSTTKHSTKSKPNLVKAKVSSKVPVSPEYTVKFFLFQISSLYSKSLDINKDRIENIYHLCGRYRHNVIAWEQTFSNGKIEKKLYAIELCFSSYFVRVFVCMFWWVVERQKKIGKVFQHFSSQMFFLGKFYSSITFTWNKYKIIQQILLLSNKVVYTLALIRCNCWKIIWLKLSITQFIAI